MMILEDKDKFYIDTNILIYSTFSNCEFYLKCKEILEKPLGVYYISNQTIHEYFRVVTNPRIFKDCLNLEKAIENISFFFDWFKIAGNIPYGKDFLIIKMREYKVSSEKIFDFAHYMIMIENHIQNIITVNEKDFENFYGINVINPLKKV
ncbi:MAG: hypothetical protein WHS77_01140 [Brevinematales bacterium]